MFEFVNKMTSKMGIIEIQLLKIVSFLGGVIIVSLFPQMIEISIWYYAVPFTILTLVLLSRICPFKK